MPSKPDIAPAVVTFTTTLIGDQVKNSEGVFSVVQKSPSLRWIRIQKSTKSKESQVVQMSEFDFNSSGFSLKKAAPEPK